MCYTLVVDLECRFISSVFSVVQGNVDHFPSGSVRWLTSKSDSLLHLPMLFTVWTYVWWSCCCLGHARLSICVVKTTLCTPLMTVSPSFSVHQNQVGGLWTCPPQLQFQIPACDQTLGADSRAVLGGPLPLSHFMSLHSPFYNVTFILLESFIERLFICCSFLKSY